MKKIVIGSRESRLAMIQTEMLQSYILEHHSDYDVEILKMKTTGDKILDRPLELIGGKGLFVKELDLALSQKRSDLSVHSMKDLPMEVPKELPLLGVSKREDPRDVLVLPQGSTEWDRSLPVGCQSRRRTLQLTAMYPDIEVKSVRGNVLTRLKKLDDGEYGALILAAAGLKRLGLEARISRYFTVEEMLPAAGQGILAIQGRSGMEYPDLSGFFDSETEICVTAERAFVRFLDGGCTSPVAAHAVISKQELILTGLYYDEETGRYAKDVIKGSTNEAEQLGERLAEQMRGRMYEG